MRADLRRKIEKLEKKYDEQFAVVFDAIRQLMEDDEPDEGGAPRPRSASPPSPAASPAVRRREGAGRCYPGGTTDDSIRRRGGRFLEGDKKDPCRGTSGTRCGVSAHEAVAAIG